MCIAQKPSSLSVPLLANSLVSTFVFFAGVYVSAHADGAHHLKHTLAERKSELALPVLAFAGVRLLWVWWSRRKVCCMSIEPQPTVASKRQKYRTR